MIVPLRVYTLEALFWLESKFGERKAATREVWLGARIGGRTLGTFPFSEHLLKVRTPKPAAGAQRESVRTAEEL